MQSPPSPVVRPMSEPLVYLNHELVPASRAHLKIYDAGIVLGATVTEMIRTFHQRLFRFDDHLARLQRSLRYVRFDLGRPLAEWSSALEELVAHNARLLPPEGELGLVIFVTAGEYATYAGSAAVGVRTTPTVCAHTFPLPFHLWKEGMQSGVHVVTPSIRHVPPQCYDPKMKYRSRMHYYLADREARTVDPKAVALLLDLDGNITETGGGNFLIVEDDRIVSPTTRNTLPGISRKVVIELAEQLGIPFVERDLQLFNVINAEEAFVASTPYCLIPAVKINGLPIGDGRPGPIHHRLLSSWSQEVGLDIIGQILDSP